jgi:uncharacterized protein (DUF2236 family)
MALTQRSRLGSITAINPFGKGSPLDAVRETVADSVRAGVSGSEPDLSPFTEPAGDPGLYGPGSMVWRVHSDLPSMLVGGFSALMLQTLHPLAMAGVNDHSDFREDPYGRLQRTASFIGTTTFGSTPAAEDLIAQVRRVHTYVVGTTPDGRPYEANDPDLLTWVHTAEVGSFLRSYQRFSGRPLRERECDAYFDEAALVAEKLGARDVPRSSAEVRAYFRRVRPQLEAGEQALATIEFLTDGSRRQPRERAAAEVVVRAAVGLLPQWARTDLRLRQPPLVDRFAVRPAARAMFGVIRWALGPSEVVEIATVRSTAG